MNNPENRQIWQKVVKIFPEANFLQSPNWSAVQENLNIKTFFLTNLTPKNVPENPYFALAVLRNAKRGRYLEISCGPLVNWQNQAAVNEIFTKIRALALENRCVFVRLRPQLLKTSENLALLSNLGLKISPMHLAAEHTVIIDLKKSEDELLSDLRRQTRYEVRRADKLKIEVKKSNSPEIFDEFYEIQQETAARQNFIPPSRELLQSERIGFENVAQIYTAYTSAEVPFETIPQDANRKHFLGTIPQPAGVRPLGRASEAREEAARPREDGRRERRVSKSAFCSHPTSHSRQNTFPLAYGLILSSGLEADYYEAASTELNHKLPGAYALLWSAIKDLKSQGYERFNLWGIAPPNSPNHRYAGVTTFKTGFGGEILEYVPAHDLILNKPKYLGNWFVETARKKWRHL